jgi:AmmeMemoRadiSam system protein A
LGGSEDRATPSYSLTAEQKRRLLEIARETLIGHLTDGAVPKFEVDDHLRQPGAAFVTLTKHGALRGCIGHTAAVAPLYETVADCAVQAGVADPRFPPITRVELDSLHIEISVLTPMQPVATIDEIEVGRDGLMMVNGGYRGLLLPQVATEYGWNRIEFLRQTCRKAGLSSDAYLDPATTIYKFEALVFGE